MYESPLDLFYRGISDTQIEALEDKIMLEIHSQVGVNIDKDELIKALKYDRDQYNKGYEDGRKACSLISCSEKLPDYEVDVLCLTDEGEYIVGYRDNQWGQDIWTTGDFASGTFNVVAWMPLPEFYREEEE